MFLTFLFHLSHSAVSYLELYCLPMKREPGLYALIKHHVNCDQLGHKGALSVISKSKYHYYSSRKTNNKHIPAR